MSDDGSENVPALAGKAAIVTGSVKNMGRMSAHFRERPIPLGRAGRPEDIAAMVGMLCGPRGRYITGQTIHVNGGWHIAT